MFRFDDPGATGNLSLDGSPAATDKLVVMKTGETLAKVQTSQQVARAGATATPAVAAVPKAGASSRLAAGWQAGVTPVANVLDFGATGDGSADDTAGIVAAIAALPADGGIVFLPSSDPFYPSCIGDYKISSTLTLGDGTASVASTRHGIRLMGTVAAGSSSEMSAATTRGVRLLWYGALGGTMVKLAGPIMMCEIAHLSMVGNAGGSAAATCLNAFHATKCWFHDLNLSGFSTIGVKVDAVGGAGLPSGVVIGGDDCTWDRVCTGGVTDTAAVGLDFGATAAGGTATDNARHLFGDCTFRGGTGVSGRGLVLRFVDNCTFVRCHLVGGSANTSIEVVPASGDTSFPKAITFVDCAVTGNVILTGAWTAPAHGLLFLPLIIEGAASIPAIAQVRGLAGGSWFGESIFNDPGADVDFRVEGDSLSHAIFLDASAATENLALLAGAAPNWQSMDGGVYLANGTTAASANPVDGVFLQSRDVVAGEASLFARSEIGDERITGLTRRLAAQFDKTNSAVVSFVTGLAFNVEAGLPYTFIAYLPYIADVTGGHKYTLSGTCTATTVWFHISSLDDATSAFVVTSTKTSLGSEAGQASSVAGMTVIRGYILVNAAGTLRIAFAQNAANATSSLRAGASFRLMPAN